MDTLNKMKLVNGLPVIISGPGEYRTRNGGRVTIDTVQDDSSPYTFRAKGRPWRLFRGKMCPRGYNVWHVSGRLDMVNERAGDITGPYVDTCPVMLWADLDAAQKAQAESKYFPGGSDDWDNAEDYFSYEPDGFISFEGEIYDIDCESVAIMDEDFHAQYCKDLPGHTVRYLPSSKNENGHLVIRYYTKGVISSVNVFRAEVPNV